MEDFPLLPPLRKHVEKHNDYLRSCLESGNLANGKPLTKELRRRFGQELSAYDPENYPESIPSDIAIMACNVFGHICPVVFVNEAFSETSKVRRSGRYIPFETKVRVVRRDNYTCQHCGKHLKDDEVEFDHIIPLSRGGSSDEHNIRLTCFDCNRDKSDRLDI
ncbi:HNH endonuclease [Candidatus Methylomirabilis lanthanidiphila]|uniref:HNH endonuclease n=1 Tax=Candidatus Methylomirabilis lanthanidiphila TaxID=2211376 RepID=A0A564ZGQ2_9BACT|nr:HNH endonuclease [Candidatus Methylomirabilis lanthanidiphila]VUZ84474.1 HNH endonuclease [Candidatus Methylomirabilis lanthanidiphila]